MKINLGLAAAALLSAIAFPVSLQAAGAGLATSAEMKGAQATKQIHYRRYGRRYGYRRYRYRPYYYRPYYGGYGYGYPYYRPYYGYGYGYPYRYYRRPGFYFGFGFWRRLPVFVLVGGFLSPGRVAYVLRHLDGRQLDGQQRAFPRLR
jgi:hypothetical protein